MEQFRITKSKEIAMDTLLRGRLSGITLYRGERTQTNPLSQEWTILKSKLLPTNENLMMTTKDHKKSCHCCFEPHTALIWGDFSILKYVSAPHCLITHEDNHYFIKDVGSKNGTFINGNCLEPYVTQKLIHGDIISLGVPSTDPIFQFKNWPKVAFLYEEVLPGKYLEFTALAKTVFSNAELLSEILSSLPLADLKNARLVNKDWNIGSSKWFYGKSHQNLPMIGCSRWDSLKVPYWPYHDVRNVSIRIKIKQNPQWITKSRRYFTDRLEQQEWEENFKQCFLDLESYLRNNWKSIRSVNLELDEWNFDLLHNVLRHLQNLTELTLAVIFNPKETKSKWSTEVFHNVKSLKFDYPESFHHGYVKENSEYEEFFMNTLKMFPALDELKLGIDDGCYTSGGKCSHKLLHALKRNLKFVEGIHKFSLWISNPNEEFFSHCETTMNLPFKNLKSLKLGKLPSIRHKNLTLSSSIAVTELIRKFSDSLEHLVLEIENLYGNPADEDLEKYTIPTCPKLRSLQITFEKTPNDREYSWFHFVSPSRTIEYHKMFPKLTTLCFKNRAGEEISSEIPKFMESFMPVDVQKCLTVTRLILPKIYHENSRPKYPKWLSRVAEIFPNVHSPLFRAVRNIQGAVEPDIPRRDLSEIDSATALGNVREPGMFGNARNADVELLDMDQESNRHNWEVDGDMYYKYVPPTPPFVQQSTGIAPTIIYADDYPVRICQFH